MIVINNNNSNNNYNNNNKVIDFTRLNIKITPIHSQFKK